MKTLVHVLRHGEVENPDGILYGRQADWHLSVRGREMAEAVAKWTKGRDIAAVIASPLERAQETAQPIAALHKLSVQTDPRLIEAANVFEGKKFGVGASRGALLKPSAWRHLWNPWRPSWGEPYQEQIKRMMAAINDARAQVNGREAVCVSHQLPIWILRSAIEGKPLLHDPRKRICSLASVTTIVFSAQGVIEGVEYAEPAAHLLRPKK
jgi:broad specificity phosphatase PhoE